MTGPTATEPTADNTGGGDANDNDDDNEKAGVGNAVDSSARASGTPDDDGVDRDGSTVADGVRSGTDEGDNEIDVDVAPGEGASIDDDAHTGDAPGGNGGDEDGGAEADGSLDGDGGNVAEDSDVGGGGGDDNEDWDADDGDADLEDFVGRIVLSAFKAGAKDVLIHGTIISTSHTNPLSSEPSRSFTVRYPDRGDLELELSNSQMLADLLPASTGTQRLDSFESWPKLFGLYEAVRSMLLAGRSFSTGDDGLMRTIFSYQPRTKITSTNVAVKVKRWQLSLLETMDKAAPRIYHLGKLMLPVFKHVQQAYASRTGGSLPTSDPPSLSDFHEYSSEDFAAAAHLSQPQPTPHVGGGGTGSGSAGGVGHDPEGTAPDTDDESDLDDDSDDDFDDDDDGEVEPTSPSQTGRDVDGNLTNRRSNVMAFPMDDFCHSPFRTVENVPRNLAEKWAIVSDILMNRLMASKGGTDKRSKRRLLTDSRWELGKSQLFLRGTGKGWKKDRQAIEYRLDMFLGRNFSGVLALWEEEYREKTSTHVTPKEDTVTSRLRQCVDSFHAGLVRRGLCVLEGLGRASADSVEIISQMVDKHPQRPQKVDAPPAGLCREPPNLSKLGAVVDAANPKIGVSVRGLRPGHIKALRGRVFTDSRAVQAFETFTKLGVMYLDGSFPPWLRRRFNAGLLTPLIKKLRSDGGTPDARPTNARDIDVSMWNQALAKAHVKEVSDRVTPQQLAVGVSSGTELKVLGTKIKLEQMAHKAFCVVFLDLKNAHNEFRRSATQDALLRPKPDGSVSPGMASLARAHEADSGQPGAIYMRSSLAARGFQFLCDGMAGGPQGSPLTNLFFPMAIDHALKETERLFPEVEVKAIQDDIDLSGDPKLILGPNGALKFLLDALEAQNDLKPNHSKFQAITTDPKAWEDAGPPLWLERRYIITDPALKAAVATAEAAAADAEATAARLTVSGAPPVVRLAAVSAAEDLKAQAAAVRASVPEHSKAYGAISCGAAIGDDAFVQDFLLAKQTELCGDPSADLSGTISNTSTLLAQDSTHSASAAIFYSLQARADFILGTHLPSQTRLLAAAIDEALAKAYEKAFGFDVLGATGCFPSQDDPSFIRDLASLKAKHGGCGFRRTTLRAPFLNVMANILPQFGTLWPTLGSVVGVGCFTGDHKATAWATFFASGSVYALEFQAEIERVKSLRASALAAAGLADNPPASDLFDTATVGFGAGVKKLHHVIFEAIGSLQAQAMRLRAAALLQDDQRKLAFEQSGSCPFSNTLFTGTPSRWLRFTNLEFHVAVQSKFGAALTCLKPLVGCPLQSSSSSDTPRVELFGNAIKKLKGATGGGTTQNHNSFVNALSYWLGARAGIPLKGGTFGRPSSCKGIFSPLSSLLSAPPLLLPPPPSPPPPLRLGQPRTACLCRRSSRTWSSTAATCART